MRRVLTKLRKKRNKNESDMKHEIRKDNKKEYD